MADQGNNYVAPPGDSGGGIPVVYTAAGGVTMGAPGVSIGSDDGSGIAPPVASPAVTGQLWPRGNW